MKNYYHEFHIPVMGTGHSVDTPIRVACLGITSVLIPGYRQAKITEERKE